VAEPQTGQLGERREDVRGKGLVGGLAVLVLGLDAAAEVVDRVVAARQRAVTSSRSRAVGATTIARVAPIAVAAVLYLHGEIVWALPLLTLVRVSARSVRTLGTVGGTAAATTICLAAVAALSVVNPVLGSRWCRASASGWSC
jgi:hypothetical protein